MIEVRRLDTPSLGDRSYRVTAGEVGVVAETHLHDDDVSGGLDLARRTGARSAVCADDRGARPPTSPTCSPTTAGGQRAAVAASLLARAGRQVVLVENEFGRARPPASPSSARLARNRWRRQTRRHLPDHAWRSA